MTSPGEMLRGDQINLCGAYLVPLRRSSEKGTGGAADWNTRPGGFLLRFGTIPTLLQDNLASEPGRLSWFAA
jgi:hypothetical protein